MNEYLSRGGGGGGGWGGEKIKTQYQANCCSASTMHFVCI